MAVKVLNVNLKLVNGCYPVALETDDGNTATLVPHSTVSDLRAEYEKMHLQPTRLDAKALIGLVAVFEDGISASDPELLAELTKLDPPQKQEAKSTKSVSATGRDTVALKVSKLLASNDEAVAAIREWMNIGELRKVLPAQIPYLLQKTFPKEVRAEMPIPGSIRPENWKKLGDNKLYDRSDDKPGTESWYVGAVEDFPGYWEEIGIPLRKLGDVLKKDSPVQNEYTINGVQNNSDTKKLLEKRKRDLVGAFREGIEVLNIIDDVHEKIDGMSIHFRVTNGKMDRTLSPLRVVFEDKTKQKGDNLYYREKYLSVGALRRIDLNEVMNASDPFEAFKPVRGATDEEEEGITNIKSANDFEKVIGWIAVNEKNAQLFTDFNRRLFAPPSESDPLLRLLASAKATIEGLLDSPKLRARLNAMYEREGQEIDQRVKDKKVA